MKRTIVFAMLLVILAPLALADENHGPTKDCFQNYTAIRCGEQAYFEHAQYCADVNLTIDDCYTDGNDFVMTFSGIKYFEVPSEFSRIVFFFYSRSWTWLGDEKDTPLPENSVISQEDNDTFKVVAPIGDKKIESVQVTVPFCYNQINGDHEKIYLRTQAGKMCKFKKAETIGEAQTVETVKNTTPSAENALAEKDYTSWILGAILVVVIVAGLIILLKPKKK